MSNSENHKKKQIDPALSKNSGRAVKYRIRKQQEKEAQNELKEFSDEGEDLLGGTPAEVPIRF